MIEFLSNESWLAPQIDFLLYLENIRVSHFEMLNGLFLSLTMFGELLIPTLICSVIYWCIDSKAGVYLFSLESLNIFLSQTIKLIACVYRPWMLSNKIHPVKQALLLAYGYSFPSGHTAQSTSIFGGLALKYGKNIFVAAAFVLVFLIVGFSRLWLGVHTPQDVVSGLAIGLILVFLMNKIIGAAEKNKNIYLYFAAGFDIIAVISILYLRYFNQYPDVLVNGVALINPSDSIMSSMLGYGLSVGLLNGAFVFRRFFEFEASQGTVLAKVIRAIIGAVLLFIYFTNVVRPIFLNHSGNLITFLSTFILGISITFIYPLLLKLISGKTSD